MAVWIVPGGPPRRARAEVRPRQPNLREHGTVWIWTSAGYVTDRTSKSRCLKGTPGLSRKRCSIERAKSGRSRTRCGGRCGRVSIEEPVGHLIGEITSDYQFELKAAQPALPIDSAVGGV
jgi:hypothetical protein